MKTLASELSVSHLIERNANTMPYHPAIISGNEVITYQSLNNRANQIAAYLTLPPFLFLPLFSLFPLSFLFQSY